MKRKLLECGGLTPPSSARLDSPNGKAAPSRSTPKRACMKSSTLSVFWILLDASLKGALLLALAGLVGLTLHRSSAAVRHMVWCIAVLGALTLPVLSWLLPSWRLPILPRETPVVQFILQPAAEPKELPVPGPSLRQPVEPAIAVADAGYVPRHGEPTSAPARTLHWSTWVLVGWGAGAVGLLGFQFVGIVGVWRLRRRSRPITDAAWKQLADNAASELGLRRRVTLIENDRAVMPMTWGVLRPVLLLPSERESWSGDQRRIVLLHELAHVKRLDFLTQLLDRLACALYWFNPLVWLAAYRLRVERERACDDCVLRAGARPSDYATLLLEAATGLRVFRPASLIAVPMARRFRLESRLMAILDPRRSRRSLSWLAVTVIILVASCLLLPLGAMRIAARTRDRAETTKEPSLATNTQTHAVAQSQSSAWTPADQLISSAITYQISAVKALLAIGVDVNATNQMGQSPFSVAVESGNVELVKLLIAHGADINRTMRGITPLHYAADRNHTETVKTLLSAGANVNTADGLPPLICAVEHDNVEMLSALMAKGADLEATDARGDTAVSKAAKQGAAKLVALLQKAGAKYAPDIFCAAGLGDVAAVEKFLAEGVDVNAKDKHENTALFYAASSGHSDVVEILLAHGADVNAATRYGWSALKGAAMNGHTELVELLIAKGAGVDLEKEPASALSVAAWAGHLTAAKALIEAGAQVNPKVSRYSPLLGAIQGNRVNVVRLLLDHGAEDPPRMEGGLKFPVTGLAEAADANQAEIVKVLLEKRTAKYSPEDLRLALSFATSDFIPPPPRVSAEVSNKHRANYVATVQALLDAGADPNARFRESELNNPAVMSATLAGVAESVKALIDKGADVNATNQYGHTAYHYSIYYGHPDIVKLLVERGADVNYRNENFAALDEAVLSGNPEFVRPLLAKGARSTLVVEGDSGLFYATAAGDAAKVKALLAKGADPNSRYRVGWTPLMTAAVLGYTELVQALLARGADPNAKLSGWENGWMKDVTPLMMVTGYERLHKLPPWPERFEIVKRLVEKGADVNASGGSPLMSAAGAGHVKTVQFLIEKGADVKGAAGASALRSAAYFGHVEIVELLKNAGAREDPKGQSQQETHSLNDQLMAAAKNGDVAIAKALLAKGADPSVKNSESNTALMIAEQKGHIEVVELIKKAETKKSQAELNEELVLRAGFGSVGLFTPLLEKGADPNAKGKRGETPLIVAAQANDFEKAEALLKKGAEVNGKGAQGTTALMEASDRGHLDMVRFLIARGADVHAKHNYGWTALDNAAFQGHSEVVKAILHAGAKLAPGKDGNPNLLMSSVERGHIETAKVFIEKGVALDAVNSQGDTAIQIAAKAGRRDIVELLRKAGARHIPNLLAAAGLGEAATLKDLIARGADVNAKDKTGDTPLTLAAANGHLETVALLLERGAAVDGKSEKKSCDRTGCSVGQTALSLAAGAGHLEIVKRLIAKGADVNGRASEGSTPLMVAAASGHRKIVQVLLEAGADVNAKNKHGSTALGYAAGYPRHPDIVKLLIARGADINVVTTNEGGPLLFWIGQGYWDIAKVLLERGADANAKNERGQNALFHLMGSAHVSTPTRVEVIKMLLDKGIDVNSKDKGGETALKYIIGNEPPEVSRLVVSRVKDLRPHFDMKYAFLQALSTGDREIVKMFIAQGATIEMGSEQATALVTATALGETEKVKSLLAKGVDVNAKEARTWLTALGTAAALGDETLVRVLLNGGAVPDWLPLQWSASAGKLGVVKTLLAQDWKSNPTNVSVREAATFALDGAADNGHTEIVRTLLEAGANPNGPWPEGGTPLMAAAGWGYTDIVKLLLQHGAKVNTKTRGRREAGGQHNALTAAMHGGHTEIVELLKKAAATERTPQASKSENG